MASDETPKIEPTLTIEGAPSIAPSASEMITEPKAAPAPKSEPEVAGADEPSLPPAPHLSAIEPPRLEPKPEPRIEPKPESRIGATVTRMPALRAETKSDAPINPEITVKPRVARFALLAACVAIAASFGAVGGSIGVAKFGPMFAPAPPAPVVAIHKDNVADEVKALKDTVAQLRSTTKSLSDNLSALKTSVNTSNSAQNTQIGKIAETLDRVEKTQAEQRKTAAATPAAPAQMASTTQATATAPETTGSIAKKQQPVPLVLGEPPANLKPPIVQDWVLRRVYDGAALIEGRDGIIEVETGSIAPGLGRIEGIKRQDGRWVVLTARGMVVGR